LVCLQSLSSTESSFDTQKISRHRANGFGLGGIIGDSDDDDDDDESPVGETVYML